MSSTWWPRAETSAPVALAAAAAAAVAAAGLSTDSHSFASTIHYTDSPNSSPSPDASTLNMLHHHWAGTPVYQHEPPRRLCCTSELPSAQDPQPSSPGGSAPLEPTSRRRRTRLPRSLSESTHASAMGTLDEVALLHAQYLTPPHLRKGKGGRQPAPDPRLDPKVEPRKAKRILANRLSAARSKLKQRSEVEGLNTQLDVVKGHKVNLECDLQLLTQACQEEERQSQSLLLQLQALQRQNQIHDVIYSKLQDQRLMLAASGAREAEAPNSNASAVHPLSTVDLASLPPIKTEAFYNQMAASSLGPALMQRMHPSLLPAPLLVQAGVSAAPAGFGTGFPAHAGTPIAAFPPDAVTPTAGFSHHGGIAYPMAFGSPELAPHVGEDAESLAGGHGVPLLHFNSLVSV